MDFNEYQLKASSTAVYPNQGKNITYVALGLSGEVGEVAEKVKKLIRGDYPFDDTFREALTKEIGDVLWYTAMICNEVGVSMQQVAENNIAKLSSRKERGTIKGNGDNR